MDFKQLRSFVAVIRYGSFTTAASKLRISQPTVSTHVRLLEEELGTPLVLRTAKRVELTAAGYKMYDQAVSMLTMHDRMLQSMRYRESDAVYLGASSIPSGYILPEILAEFSAQNTDAKFVISQDSSQGVIDSMLTGLFDIGFVGMPVEEDTIEAVPFHNDKIVIVAPNAQPYTAVDPANPDAVIDMLKTMPMILRKSGSATRVTGNRILEDLGLEESDMNIVAHLDDQEAIKNLVASGFGITMMSECAVRNRLDGGWLLAFDVPGVDAARRLYILRRKNGTLSTMAEKFFAFVLNNKMQS